MVELHRIESILEENNIIFLTYGGTFTQSLIAGMTNALEKEVEDSELSMKISNNIFVVFIELAQNIMNYSKKLKSSDMFDPKGIIYVGKKDDKYFVCSHNIISTSDKEQMQEHLEFITSATQEQIKQRYKDVRRSGKNKHEKGGGLGLLEIAKKANKVEYTFEAVSTTNFKYTICAHI